MVKQPKFIYLNPLALAMGILLALSLSACQQAVPSTQRFSSEKGVNVEAFMPADTFLFAKIGSRDEGQLGTLKTLNGYFPSDPIGSIIKEFNQGFREGANLNELGLDYDQDILPILGNKSQFFFAMSPRQDAQPIEADAAPKVNFLLAMTIADEGKFDGLLDNQIAKNLLKKEDYSGQSIYSQISTSDTPAYLSRYMDTVFLATSLDLLKTGLDNVKANKDLLADNKVFQRAMLAYKPNLAVVYANLDEVIKVMVATKEDNEREEVTKALAGTDAANKESLMLVLTAEKNGIRVASRVLAKSGVDFTKTAKASTMQAYLMKKIPAVAPILYVEGSGLKASYENMISVLGTDEQFADGLNQMKEFLNGQGLDFEKDLMAIMDKGIAFVIEDTGTPIPGVAVYLDASSNPDGANKTVTAINKGLDLLFAEVTAESPDISMVLSKEEVQPGKLWKFKVNLDTILAAVPSEVAKKLTGQKIELYYGLLEDDVMTIALKADLDSIYAKDQVVEKNPEFAQSLNFLGGEHRGLAYLAPAQFIQLMDRYMKLMADSTGQPTTIPEYDQIKSSIEPLKSISFSGGDMKPDEVNAQFFLHIAQ